MITMDGSVDEKTNRLEIEGLLFWQAIGCGVLAVLTLIFWKQGYSRGSILKLEKKKELEAWERQGLTNYDLRRELNSKRIDGLSLSDQVKEIFKRKYLIVVIFNYGLGFGIIVACGALLTEVVHAVGYETVSSKFLTLIQFYGPLGNIAAIFWGMISSLIYGCKCLQKKKQFAGMIAVLSLT